MNCCSVRKEDNPSGARRTSTGLSFIHNAVHIQTMPVRPINQWMRSLSLSPAICQGSPAQEGTGCQAPSYTDSGPLSVSRVHLPHESIVPTPHFDASTTSACLSKVYTLHRWHHAGFDPTNITTGPIDISPKLIRLTVL